MLGTSEKSKIKMTYQVPVWTSYSSWSGWSSWTSWTSWTGINPLPICQMKKNLIKSKKELAKYNSILHNIIAFLKNIKSHQS